MADRRPGTNPFPGLRPFDTDQHHLFFGREEQVDEALRRLEETRFLAVVGPSGSGKSSLIRAGVIPKLNTDRIGDHGGDWQVVIFNPGDAPIDNMARALYDAGISEETDASGLRGNPSTLADMVLQARKGREGCVLLLVDQFEELFRYGSGGTFSMEEAAHFVSLLLAASQPHGAPVYVLVTMRADFLGECTAFQGLPEAINRGQYLVPRMTREQLRDAVEKPVVASRAEIAPRLVDRLLNEAGDNPDRLPIMQHALMRTWDYWERHAEGDRPLDEAHYEAIGTMSEALSLHAEEAYRELPDEDSRRIAEVLFRCLTDTGAVGSLRRPTSLKEICAVTGAGQESVVAVADRFRCSGRWFLLPYPEVPLDAESVVDIVHESLMRVWKRLVGWVEEEAASAQLYLRLSNTAALYQVGRAGLYQGPDLELALNWRGHHQPTAAWATRYDVAFERAITFLDHSKKERDFAIATREERQRRQLKRARMFAVLMGAASIVFLLFLLFTLNLFFTAEENRKEAIAQREVAERERLNAERQRGIAEEQREAAERERLNAERQRGIAEEQRSVAERERLNAERQRVVAVEQKQNAERQRGIAEEQREAAERERLNAERQRGIAEEQRSVAERERQNSERLRRLSIARSLAAHSLKVHQKEEVELGALLALQAYLFNLKYGGSPQDPDVYQALQLAGGALDANTQGVLRGHEDGVRGVGFGADGRYLISVSDDGSLRTWDMADPSRKGRVISADNGALRSVACSPDGRLLAYGGVAGMVWICQQDGAIQASLPVASQEVATPSVVSSLAFSPNGQYLACGSLDGGVRVWDVRTPGMPPVVSRTQVDRVQAVAFSADSRYLAWGGDREGLHLLGLGDADTPPEDLGGQKHQIRSVVFSPDGQFLVAGSADGTVLVWDMEYVGLGSMSLIGHTSAVTSLSFSRDSQLLASGSLDRTVRVWNVRKPEEEPVRIGHDAWVWTVAFGPDGDRLASGCADKYVRLWTARTQKLAVQVQEKVGRDMSLAEWRKYVGVDIPYERTSVQPFAEQK